MKLTDLRMKQTGLRKFPRQQGDKAAKILFWNLLQAKLIFAGMSKNTATVSSAVSSAIASTRAPHPFHLPGHRINSVFLYHEVMIHVGGILPALHQIRIWWWTGGLSRQLAH